MAQDSTASPSTTPLAGKVAVVTGSGQGLGLAYAQELARQGAAVVEAVVEAAAGHGGVVVLVGDAGVGKSRLALTVSQRADQLGMARLAGRCVPGDSPVPYRPLTEAFASAFRGPSPPRDPQLAGFGVHLRGTGTFRPVSPVVFVTLVEGISQCEQLASAVRRGPLDVPLDFPYHPHVTIAHHLADDALDRAFRELADFDCTFDADQFHLYVHDEQDGWQPTRDFPLSPAGAP